MYAKYYFARISIQPPALSRCVVDVFASKITRLTPRGSYLLKFNSTGLKVRQLGGIDVSKNFLSAFSEDFSGLMSARTND